MSEEWEIDGVSRKKAIGTVFAVVFVDLLGFGIIIPILPLYAREFGADGFVVGILIASYSVMQFIFAPILGRLSDEKGRRKILMLSLFGSTLAWTLFGVAGEIEISWVFLGLAGNIYLLFAARILAGAMGGNISAAQAYIADITPPEDRAKGLGLLGAAFGLGFVFGPALGGLFSSNFAVELVSDFGFEVNSFTLPSFVAAFISGVNLIFAYFFLPETNIDREGEEERESRLSVLMNALSDDALSGLVISFFLVSLAFSGMEAMFVLFTADQYQFGEVENGILLSYIGVVIAVVQGGIVGRLAKRFGEAKLAVTGAAIESLALIALPFTPFVGYFPLLGSVGAPEWFTPRLFALIVVLTFLAIGNGFTNVSLNTLVSTNSSEETQGSAFGLTQSAGSLARAIGPWTAGLLYVGVAYWSPFVIGGLLIIPIIFLLSFRTAIEAKSVQEA